jgi:DNA-binding NtrC family response regulator
VVLVTEGTAPDRESPLRILLVDDEPLLVRSIVRAWPLSRMQLVTAASAEAALDILRSSPVDILVSDIDMPGMSGLDLMKLARREFPDVPRVLITGNATTERALEAINEGEIYRFLTKPFPVQKLVDVVTALAERLANIRRDGADANRRARTRGLLAWVEERFPGATTNATPLGKPRAIDTAALAASLEAAGWEGSLRLLKRSAS